MSLVEMQSCLARLYTDFPFQQLFFLDPTVSLKEYQLTPAERQALTALNRTELTRFALAVRHKSLEKFERNFPLLFKAAGPQLERYYPRFYHLFRLPDEDRQLLEFGRFMAQTFQADQDLPPYLGELTRYERQLITARFKPNKQRRIYPESQPELSLEDRFSLAPGVTYEQYRHNIVALAQAIEQDQTIDRPETGFYIFLVYLAPGKARPQILELSPATRKLLEFCNGERTAGEIISKLELLLGQPDLQPVVMQKLTELVGLGVLNA